MNTTQKEQAWAAQLEAARAALDDKSYAELYKAWKELAPDEPPTSVGSAIDCLFFFFFQNS